MASLTTTNQATVQLVGGDGRMRIKAGELLATAPLPLEKIAYSNPPPEVSGRGVRLAGRVDVGAGATRGNSENSIPRPDARRSTAPIC